MSLCCLHSSASMETAAPGTGLQNGLWSTRGQHHVAAAGAAKAHSRCTRRMQQGAGGTQPPGIPGPLVSCRKGCGVTWFHTGQTDYLLAGSRHPGAWPECQPWASPSAAALINYQFCSPVSGTMQDTKWRIPARQTSSTTAFCGKRQPKSSAWGIGERQDSQQSLLGWVCPC